MIDEDENVYGPRDDLNAAVDTLVEVYLGPDVLDPYIGSTIAPQEVEADGFMPLDECCLDGDGSVCTISSDPYSFRATVVLPYWPERFRNVSFRNFFERTIRAEAPAHVFLRICWVDVCQMRRFEDAYRRWLRTQTAPGRHCETTDALNSLIDVLVHLRNVYPEAILRGCDDDGGDGAAIILNQTLLGNASFTTSDDNS